MVNFCKKIDLFSEYISGYISENISEYFLNNNLKNILKQIPDDERAPSRACWI